MIERDIEKRFCREAKSRLWLPLKFVSPGHAGVPDRLLLRDGRGTFVEMKTATGKITPLQAYTHSIFAAHGVPVHIVRSVEEGLDLLDSLDDE